MADLDGSLHKNRVNGLRLKKYVVRIMQVSSCGPVIMKTKQTEDLMILSIKFDSCVKEILFSGFHFEVIFSAVHGDYWTLLLQVVEDEWENVSYPAEEDFPECIYHLEFYTEDDII